MGDVEFVMCLGKMDFWGGDDELGVWDVKIMGYIILDVRIVVCSMFIK